MLMKMEENSQEVSKNTNASLNTEAKEAKFA